VPAGLRALGDDDVGSDLQRLPGLIEVRDLNDQHRLCAADGLDQRPRVAERQHDGARPVCQRALDRGGVGRPALKPDAPGLRRARRDDLQLALQPAGILTAAADDPEPPGVGNGCRQRASGHSAHRRQGDGMLQREEFRERGTQRHTAIVADEAGSLFAAERRLQSAGGPRRCLARS
jgi:hypothetical protein